MKVVALILVSSVAIVIGAPAPEAPVPEVPEPQDLSQEQFIEGSLPGFARLRRSHIGLGAYGSPCQAASGHIPIIAPSPYGYGHAHAVHGPIHHAYPQYGYPAYREDIGGEEEMMDFSDMNQMMTEQMPMARFAYGSAPVSANVGYGGGLGGYGQSQVVGPAVGVFPNANVGGCNVPLLLSCSPSITAGHVVKSHHQGYGGYAGAGSGLGGGLAIGAGSGSAGSLGGVSGYSSGAHEAYRGSEDALRPQESHRIDLTPTQDQVAPVREMNTNHQ